MDVNCFEPSNTGFSFVVGLAPTPHDLVYPTPQADGFLDPQARDETGVSTDDGWMQREDLPELSRGPGPSWTWVPCEAEAYRYSSVG